MSEGTPRDQAVVCAYVFDKTIVYSWHRSMMELMAYDISNNQRVSTAGFVAVNHGTDGLPTARNLAVQTFLDEDKADWLWWVDTDMGFEADAVDRLIEAADPVERPIVGALCFQWHQDEPDGRGGYRHSAIPTIYDWAHIGEQRGWRTRLQYPINTVTQCAGTGAAMVLIHRSVFETIEQQHGRVWYDRVMNTTTGQLIGEDLSFCLRASALDIPIFVHTGIPTTHYKSFWLAEEDYWRQVALQSAAEKLSGDDLETHVREGLTPESAVAATEGFDLGNSASDGDFGE